MSRRILAALLAATGFGDSRLTVLEALGGPRERIRADLQRLWLAARTTVVLVTHSIEEAVQLSTKVCIITPRPGRLHGVVDIDLPWPRDLEVKKSPAFATYVSQIGDIFHQYGAI